MKELRNKISEYNHCPNCESELHYVEDFRRTNYYKIGSNGKPIKPRVNFEETKSSGNYCIGCGWSDINN